MHQRWSPAASSSPLPPVAYEEAFPDFTQSSHTLSNDVHDAYDDSSSDDGDLQQASLDTLESSIFRDYGDNSFFLEKPPDEFSFSSALSKIRDLLVASRLKAMSCLICLEKVRAIDPIWHCTSGCHAIYHLICIQAWANEACKAAADRARARLSQDYFPNAKHETRWHCPKCRIEYSEAAIPRKSLCYCSKVVDPPIDPWTIPHSCGQICGRMISDGCGHECKLLCHPGICPPCPQFVRTNCYCGGASDVRRCGHKHFSCGGKCSKGLVCGIHVCQQACHAKDCPPCQKSGAHKCRCGRVEEVRACSESDFSCGHLCDKLLSCKKHWCKKVCHPGPCGDCEFQGRQQCPCGKVSYREMPCDAVPPTCGSTCEKLLPCSLHRCQERCHNGDCRTICRVVTLKICRCGSLRKEVPCHQDLQCERKCQCLRDCKRHPCKRRCCNGDCPPCSEICGKRLRCGNHKCPSLCHRGPCAPCPVSVRISCACGSTAYEVPCGAEKDKKPPRCSKRCNISPCCRHGMDCKPHRCHYGACPPCDLVCNEILICGHICKQRCHGPRPPPNLEYSLKQKRKRRELDQGKEMMGTPCPPCDERILIQCLGGHMGGERIMVCSQSTDFSCGSLCGNPLSCGNHICQRICHKITISRKPVSQAEELPSGLQDVQDTCEQCMLVCQKKRIPPCSHPCTQICHSGTCLPCKALLKRSCYCGSLVHSFECSYFNSLSEEKREKQLSCGGPCHRKLPNCAHLCSDICHPGPCKMATACRKRVTVRCICLRLKKDWICSDVQSALVDSKLQGQKGQIGVGLLECDDECLRISKERRLKEEIDELRHRKTAVIEEAASKKVTKRRRQCSRETDVQPSKLKGILSELLKWFLLVMLMLLISVGIYFSVRGLQSLSDWMNELDAKRPRKRPGTGFIM